MWSDDSNSVATHLAWGIAGAEVEEQRDFSSLANRELGFDVSTSEGLELVESLCTMEKSLFSRFDKGTFESVAISWRVCVITYNSTSVVSYTCKADMSYKNN